MNILLITPSLPDRLKRIQSLHRIQALARDHKVHLLSLSGGPAHPAFDEVATLCASVTILEKYFIHSIFDCALAVLESTPFEVAYCKSRKMERAVKDLVARHNIDLIYVKRLRSAQYAENQSLPKILDTTDAMSLFYTRSTERTKGLRKIFNRAEASRYGSYEKDMGQKYSHWVACSEVDKRYVQEKVPGAHISVIPNGVDTLYHRADPRAPLEPHTVMVSGLMDKFVNIEAALFFAKDIFPLILRKIPSAHLFIVGPNPVKAIQNLASPNITVTGYVEDIRPLIDKSSVIACPVLTGTGTRNKILQAWAHKKPVVTTTQGLEGLPGVHGTHCLVADTKEEFAKRVIELMNNQELSEKLGENGYELVEKNYSINSMHAELNKLLSSLLRNK